MTDNVVVVDDDISNLTVAGHILSGAGMHVAGLKSGEALLRYIEGDEPVDIILLDINMPGMNGFEALKKVRLTDRGADIPVVFLTADEHTETEREGFEMGVSDYIKKPFEPEILVRRIKNVLQQHAQVVQLKEDMAIDQLTGLFNKQAIEERMPEVCRDKEGCLAVVDLDSFKMVNDMLGHDIGDRVLKLFSRLIKKHAPEESVVGRIGGDEFLIFLTGMETEIALKKYTEKVNSDLKNCADSIVDEMSMIPLGVSIGAVFVPLDGTEFEDLFVKADRALQHVKQNGKHGFSVAGESDEDGPATDIKSYLQTIGERHVTSNAMWMGQESFVEIFHYMMRYMSRYDRKAYTLLITANSDEKTPETLESVDECLREVLQQTLRNSDFMMQTARMQYFLFLPEVDEADIDAVIERIKNDWGKTPYHDSVTLKHEAESIKKHEEDNEEEQHGDD